MVEGIFATLLCIIIYVFVDVARTLRGIEYHISRYVDENTYYDDEEEMSSYEEERKKREDDFNDRIKRLQLELELGGQAVKNEPIVTAEGLYDIPHTVVDKALNNIPEFAD